MLQNLLIKQKKDWDILSELKVVNYPEDKTKNSYSEGNFM